MPFWRFTLYTRARLHPVGVLPWAGSAPASARNWEKIRPYLHYADYAVVAALIAGRGLGRVAVAQEPPQPRRTRTLTEYGDEA